ncbi:bifunctional proline dehydrogenase/L-glutamate gamma-semialdehyde dehydrogenase [Microbacterium ulmi]|uniref:L-glutamate gamma-semialdehyde dehydrogenase n=1 Tax=Microbacterium ulmi TaxID=179095 RepID=A0A7Y2Q253_9MICO|nr:bifunctional proline dehydrogenase/L-glutamate gamma-semialdehyde dehydrogenase [Microbacterium ulmi]NII69066.1 RHH-type proline utilization regulon transcriptional repressor/proline dehydrogenase/delta 1-pyrroline-5-carboxylate dehydrogenase [Microbacterium ulmi]NNH04645.1 bifunctional proline dehydrogenase/L-glutamate gamma-semialdehyde dehydrogenase [Microbacterium ulmi]
MVTDPSRGDTDHTAPGDDLAVRAVELARRWIAESAKVDVDPAAERLAGVLKDPDGLPFTMGFVDGVMRPESLSAAAASLHRVAPLVPEFLPWYLRGAVRVGGAVAPVLPSPVVPIARRVLREMVGHLVVDARPDRLGPAIARLRESGARLNLNLLGEAVLGETEALRRLDGIHELVRRPDVDYVSVKVSAIASHISMWAFDEVVDRVVERLLPLYLSAAADGTFINLDMEEYRDLDLTIAVFMRILGDPRLRALEAGIVLQAYLPDALPALRGLTDWAGERVAAGGARIKVRLVKGANLAMERVDAVMHGWSLATYDAKVDSDANYLRCLEFALRPQNTTAVRLGVAGHNLFDIAYAWLLAGERGVRPDVEFEMLLGMAQGQVEAVAREVGHVLLYVPVVRPDEFDVAISYLVRRLEENASSENFLSAAFDLADDPVMFERERERFAASIARAADPALPTGARRRQDRAAERAAAPSAENGRRRLVRSAGALTDGLTEAVLGIARSSASEPGTDTAPLEPGADAVLFGGERFVETAVYAPRETGTRVVGALGFVNAPDTDPALPANRAWARGILDRIEISTAGDATIDAARVDDAAELEAIVARVRAAGAAWGARPAGERAAALHAAALNLEQRRGELIEVAASETGKVFAEADVEVSEAVDFANYYAATARELDRVSGAIFEPSRLTVVTPPWNFPIAIPAGGVLAALAAGSGVVFKPAPQARRCAAVVAEALWQALDEAGVPRDVLALVDLDEGALGRRLVSHPDVDRVILTGSWETARLFRSWRPELPLLAETSGKNAMIVTPSADLDLAASDLIRSAFGHAGQKCSAASLAILVGPVGRSHRFARQLVDATRSLRIGPPTDPLSEVGPVIEVPHGKLEWALTTLDDGEQWLVEPQRLDVGPEYAGRFWTPGIRTGVEPGSRFHREEFFGPVLGVMHAASLSHAIELQNDVAYGLTAGLYTQDPHDLAVWLDRVEAGNLYVNRGITGAIVQRQPFGGWKRSSVGAGTKAGGPNYLVGLGSWRASAGATGSSTLHLRGLDSRITNVIEAAQPSLDYDAFEWLRRAALADAIAWDREFGQVKDVSGLGVERNLFRYRPISRDNAGVAIRATEDAPLQAILRVVVAGIRSGSGFTLSAPTGLPPAVRRALSDLERPVFVETETEWLERMTGGDEAEWTGTTALRARLVGSRPAVAALHRALSEAVGGDPDLAVYDNEVTTAGRIELLPFLHEQSVTITAHRFGNPDLTFQDVI